MDSDLNIFPQGTRIIVSPVLSRPFVKPLHLVLKVLFGILEVQSRRKGMSQYCFSSSSIALLIWSGQLVGLVRQSIPERLLLTSSIFLPFIRLQSPLRFPSQPPTTWMFWIILSSSASIYMYCEQVPEVLYRILFITVAFLPGFSLFGHLFERACLLVEEHLGACTLVEQFVAQYLHFPELGDRGDKVTVFGGSGVYLDSRI